VKQNTIYVCNIPYHFEEADLVDLFKDCGVIKDVHIPVDEMTRKKRGFAFVTLESDKAARKALNYDGHKVMTRRDGHRDAVRPLRVAIAQPDRNTGFESRDREFDRNRRSRGDERTKRRRRSRSRSDSREKKRSRRRRSSSRSDSPPPRRDKYRERRSHRKRDERSKRRYSSSESDRPKHYSKRTREDRREHKKSRKYSSPSSNSSSDFEEEKQETK